MGTRHTHGAHTYIWAKHSYTWINILCFVCEHLHIHVHIYAYMCAYVYVFHQETLTSICLVVCLFVYSLETGFLHQKPSRKGLHTGKHLFLVSTGICMHVCIQAHSYNHISTNAHFYKHMTTKKRTPFLRTNKLKSQDSLLCNTQKWWPPNMREEDGQPR